MGMGHGELKSISEQAPRKRRGGWGWGYCSPSVDFSAFLRAYLCAPLRLNFSPQFATILRKALRRQIPTIFATIK